MNKMSFLPVVAITAAVAIVSCSRSGASTTAADVSVDSDSTHEIAQEQEPVHLPDTAYASVSLIKPVTTIMIDTVGPNISSLRDMYTDVPGHFTFRNGMRRQADFGGTIKGTPTKIEVVWAFETASRGTWGGGSGWTGQPLYVEWPDSLYNTMKGKNLMFADASKREVMVGSLCGRVYFIDFETGKASRSSIDVSNPIKGTMSLDPTLNGNLYVGQGVPDNQPFGALVINLNKNEVTHTFGRDPKAGRGWGAYDSSPLRLGQYLFRPGENGTLYKLLIGEGRVSVQSTFKYTVRGTTPGIESSMAIYHNYGYTGDNSGMIVCVNLDTMKPVWCYNLGDDIDSSIILLEEDGVPYIYTGCEVDKQTVGDGKYVKLNALSGEEKWCMKVPAEQRVDGSKHFDGGFYCTALPGTADCDSLLFANCVLNTRGCNGVFMAINRYTGSIVYTKPTKFYAWSSPVGFINEQGKMYVVTGDCSGNIYLIEGKTGEIIFTEHVGNNFESSPVVVGNEFVVGSRGEKIYKMRVI